MLKNKGTQDAPKLGCKYNCDKAVLRQFISFRILLPVKFKNSNIRTASKGRHEDQLGSITIVFII